MPSSNPFEAPESPGPTGDLPALDVMSIVTQSAMLTVRAGPILLVSYYLAVFITMLTLACCILPGLFAAPLVVWGMGGLLLSVADGRLQFGRLFEPFQRATTLWAPAVSLVLVYLVVGIVAVVPSLVASFLLGRAAIVVTLPLAIALAPVTTGWLMALFLAYERDTPVSDAISRATDLVRVSLIPLLQIGALHAVVSAVVMIPVTANTPDLSMIFRDPSALQAYTPGPLSMLVSYLIMPLLLCWQAVGAALVYRVLAGGPPSAR